MQEPTHLHPIYASSNSITKKNVVKQAKRLRVFPHNSHIHPSERGTRKQINRKPAKIAKATKHSDTHVENDNNIIC